MPPPAVLREKVLLLTVIAPLLKIPPPTADAELAVKVLFEIVDVPE
jgi:hypothetical protein